MKAQPSYNQLFTGPYSFQAKEHDDEVKGDGNSVNYKYRMHDPRLGRFFAIDPLSPKYPRNSPYSFCENRVIDGIELEGLERVVAIMFNGDVNYRGKKLEVLNGEDIAQYYLTNNPGKQLAQALIKSSTEDENGIGFVAIWGHGTAYRMYGTKSGSLFKTDLKELQTAMNNGEICFSEDAVIFIGNCNAGSVDFNGEIFAQKLADMTGVTVIAGNTENTNDMRRDHRGSVGIEDETNGEMKYTMFWPKLDKFKEFNPGQEPVDLESIVDLKPILERAKSLPVDPIDYKKVELIPIQKPEIVE